MFVKLSSSTLRKAAEIQERIERLQEELGRLLPADAEASSAPVVVTPIPRVAARRGQLSRLRSEEVGVAGPLHLPVLWLQPSSKFLNRRKCQ
jgi:hypothetical protein